MIRGVLSAVIATAAWVSIQILVMRVRPARRRFKSMLAGYLISLPLVALIYMYAPWSDAACGKTLDQAAWTGWFHAYMLHLLLFFQYVHFFYHVERSVTVRLLGEVQQAPGNRMTLDEIEQKYSLRDMITCRLAVMTENGFIVRRDGRYHNSRKGRFYARLMALSSRIFGSVSQKDRQSQNCAGAPAGFKSEEG